MPRFSSRRF